jgi:catecholate siderophore receptor
MLGAWDSPQHLLAATYRAPLSPGLRTNGRGLEVRQAPAPQSSPALRFAIASGSLRAALDEFARVSGVTVTVADELVRGLTSPGVSGLLPADEALQQLLDGTNLTTRFTSPRAVTIEIRVAVDNVEVTGAAPTVSSAKFTEPIVDIPKTITVVSRQLIDQQGATTLRDVLRNVPGITIQAGEGGGGLPGDTMTMRGFSATGDIFVDGVRDVGSYSRDAFNLEQVEVIKGPSSSFGGRGSTGGAINLSTKAPGLQAIKQATFGVGSADYARSTVDINTRVAALGESTALRFNAMWQDAGVAGRKVVNNSAWAIAPSIAFGLGKPTRVTASYQHVTQDNVPDYGLPWGTSTDAATGEVFQSGAFNATPAVAQDNFYGLANYDFEDIANDVATAKIEHDVAAGVTLRNVTRYGETYRNSAITAPRPPNRQLQRREMRNETLANQTSLSATAGTGAVRHALSAGLEFGQETTFTRNSAQTTNQPQITLRNPDPTQLPLGPMPEINGNPSTATTDTVGIYVFDTVDAGAKLQLNGGLRWDRSAVDYELTTLSTGVVTRLDRTDRMLSWQGGVVYKPKPNGSVYLGYGTSFNPASDAGTVGTALSATDTSVNSVNLKPEKSRNIEVGTKWAGRGDRLLLNAAYFHTEKTNARTRNLANDPYVLAGRQRVQGVEVGVSGQVVSGLNAFVSYSQMDSKIIDSANDLEDGRDLALTPERTASLWMSWDASDRFTVGGGAQFMDAVFRNTTTDLQVPSYWLSNAMASYEINQHLTLRANATNLGDKSYADRVGGGHYVPGPRRSFQLTASVGF